MFFKILVLYYLTIELPYISGYIELEPGHIFKTQSNPNGLLKIYCYSGMPKAVHRIWETVQLQLNLTDGFEQFDGYTPQEVRNKFSEQKSSWNILNNIYSWKKRNIRLNPFNQTCIGVFTEKEYHVQLNRTRVDYWKVLYFIFGCLLLVYSPKLAKNSAFYYITGTSVGSVALILFLIYLFSRLFPRKPIMYTVLAGGSSVCLYLFQLFWENMRVVLTDYKTYFFSCITITSLISFIICYRFGPVSDPRSINLIQWTLQVFGLAFIFISSEFQEASIALIILILTFYNIPKSVFQNTARACFRTFSKPKPRKLLSEDEFHQQSVVETNKALTNLRNFCSSPDCDQWKTITRLKNPVRFARFIQGASHLTDSEVLAFETTHCKALFSDQLTDDESGSD